MWPSLKIPPINLWNVPYIFKEKTIIDKILDAELRYYIKMGRYAQVVFMGSIQFDSLKKELGYINGDDRFQGLEIIIVNKEDYLRVG